MAETTTRARKSRASRGADQADQDAQKAQDQGQQQPEQPQAKPEAKPEPAKPTASLDLGPKPIVYYWPKITLADGTVAECGHTRYGHESERSARVCAQKLAAEHGATLAK